MTIQHSRSQVGFKQLAAIAVLAAGISNAQAQLSIGPPVLVSDIASQVSSIITADLDGDGDQDLLASIYGGAKILWFENLDGAGTFSSYKFIAHNVNGVQSITAADFNGDGYIDVASAAISTHAVAWHENPGAAIVGDPNAVWPEHPIATDFDKATAVVACDINLDSKPDLVVADEEANQVVWFENSVGLGNFAARQLITATLNNPTILAIGDINHDAYPDIAVSASSLDGLQVFLNSAGSGVFVPGSVEPLGINSWRSIQLADLDGDSNLDLVGSAYQDERIVWFSNPNGDGNFVDPKVVADVPRGVFSIATADLDNDGDPEVLAAMGLSDRITWYDNLDNSDEFGSEQTITAELVSATLVLTADITGDGHLDVIGGGYFSDTIEYYEVIPVAFGDSHFMTPGLGARTLKLADFNQDGMLDLAGGGSTGLRIFLGDLSGGAFSPAVSTATTNYVFDLEILDFDDDGDLDVMLGGNLDDNPICLNANQLDTDGFFQCSVSPAITDSGSFVSDIELVDMDGDGDQDILYGTMDAIFDPDTGRVAWIENTNGWLNITGPEQVIATMGRVYDICILDVNQDGLDDIVLALPGPTGPYGGELAWLERLTLTGDFAPLASIDTTIGGVNSIQLGDADGDGDLDLFAASWDPPAVYWYENDSLNPAEWPRTTISDNQVFTEEVRLGDIDRDGDLDVCVVDGSASKLAWFENTDGQGRFREQVIATYLLAAMTLELADMDADGDLDAVVNSGHGSETSPFGQTEWFENLIDPYAPGDLNCDGGVDAFDIDAFILALLDHYGYSQVQPDCGWRLADLNGDGSVNAFDIDPFIACLLNQACP